MYNNILYAILEMKKPANKMEMVLEDDINRKALWAVSYTHLFGNNGSLLFFVISDVSAE